MSSIPAVQFSTAFIDGKDKDAAHRANLQEGKRGRFEPGGKGINVVLHVGQLASHHIDNQLVEFCRIGKLGAFGECRIT